MGHQDTYHDNEAYADFLSGWDTSFFQKYIQSMVPDTPEHPVLDVGCGVGQVVASLTRQGITAHGVDVSRPNIERARQHSETCQLYDGQTLPFDDGTFAVVGAFNVLEHVDRPEGFLKELVRVTQPQGRVVVSSPNFFRVMGWRDYHPKMRGLGNKISNLRRLLQKRRILKGPFEHWRFDRMEPIVREPFRPDDDAIIATNPMEISAFLQQAGCRIESVACTDRVVSPWIDFCLNAGPWKYGMFNGFVVARKLERT